MRSRFQFAAIAAAFAIAPTAAPAGPPKGNIVAAAMKSPDLETLVAAVKAAGLVSTLAGPGPYTVFAPTDTAFAKLPAGTVDTLLQPANRDQLRSILTYHVVSGSVTAAQLIAMMEAGGGSARLTTVEGSTLTATLSGSNVIITDERGGMATVIMADMIQSNGVVHVTDAVSLPQ